MVDKILGTLKSTSVVVLSYMLSQQSGFVDFMERRGTVYGVLVVTLNLDSVVYNVYHLSNTELRELYEKLPVFNQVMCNFSIKDDVVFYDNNVKILEVDKETLQLFAGQVVSYTESENTFWKFLHYCLINNIKLSLDGYSKPVAVSQLRFSDSTPNILLSVADAQGKFTSKIVYSLDKSVTTQDLYLATPEAAGQLGPFVFRTGDGRGKVITDTMEVSCMDQESFDEVFSVQLLSALLGYREYFRCMRDAVEVVRYYVRLLDPTAVAETPKTEYTATVYTTNCEIEYNVDKPRIAALKKPKDTESHEEFVQAAKRLLSDPQYVDQWLGERLGSSTLDFAFVPTLKAVLRAYQEGGLETVLAYDAGIAARHCLYAIEVFKWKAAMAYFNEVPSCFGNAFVTKFGVLRLKLGEVV